jgi:hypothetical protein
MADWRATRKFMNHFSAFSAQLWWSVKLGVTGVHCVWNLGGTLCCDIFYVVCLSQRPNGVQQFEIIFAILARWMGMRAI